MLAATAVDNGTHTVTLGFATPASGTVTQLNTGTGLTGGPITATGTISLANTTVAAGTYTAPTLTVNAQGQLTAAVTNALPATVSSPAHQFFNSYSSGAGSFGSAQPASSDLSDASNLAYANTANTFSGTQALGPAAAGNVQPSNVLQLNATDASGNSQAAQFQAMVDGSLSLQFGATGSATQKLSIDNGGIIHFAPSQTFAGTVISVGASAPLASSGGTNPTISLTGIVGVANGGTGASTAAAARTNLGAAGSGANSDITSLTGLTTPLAISEGGTGTATGAAHNTMFAGPASGGAGAPSFRQLVAADIPSLSASYVALNPGTQQTGNINVFGDMIISGSASTVAAQFIGSGSGTGVQGQCSSSNCIGVRGLAQSNTSIAAVFDNQIAAGKVLSLQSSGVEKASVDATGKFSWSGTASLAAADGSNSAGKNVTIAAGNGNGTNQNGGNIVLTPGTATGTGATGTVSVSSLTDTGLTSGNCVQATDGGLLMTIAGPCVNGNTVVTSVTATAPLASTGGTAPTISLSGTVAVANGGTGASSTSQNSVFAGPTSEAGAPSFRALAAGDLPSLSSTYVTLSGVPQTGEISVGNSTNNFTAATFTASGLNSAAITANATAVNGNGINITASGGAGVLISNNSGYGVEAFTNIGIALQGNGGNGIGVRGVATQASGIAGMFDSQNVSGKVLSLQSSGVEKASVDPAGNFITIGTYNGNGSGLTSLNPANLAQAGAASGQVLAWSGTAWTPATPVLANLAFNSGAAAIGYNQFIGMGAANDAEGPVQQIVAVAGHLSIAQCYVNSTTQFTFTVRKNGGDTALTCTTSTSVTNGLTGSGTATNVTVEAGDLLDIQVSGNPVAAGSFAIQVTP